LETDVLMAGQTKSFVEKYSFRIEEEEINAYLADENKYAARLFEEEASAELVELLQVLEGGRTNSDILHKCDVVNSALDKDSESILFSAQSLNQTRFVNQYFISINAALIDGGEFVCWFNTSGLRKKIILNRYPAIISYPSYCLDFIWHRVFPKIHILKKIYFAATKGKRRVYPRSEVLGRLYSCGFKVIDERPIGHRYYVTAKKVQEPYNDPHPSYGPIVRLQRIGKDGRLFNVYKFRTMHAYSEYLQNYIYENNNLQEGGKFANDYRVSSWGKVMRKYWLDELPMFINLFKGDMKLVGVRPLSKHYFSLYTPEMQELRTKVKPGLLPPFYVDMPDTIEEVQESEKKYIEAYLQKPLGTDWKYFWGIMGNIVFKNKRSK